MTVISGMLSAADAVAYTDALAKVFRASLAGLPGVKAQASTAQTQIVGDGTSGNPGLVSADLKAAIKANLPALVNQYDFTRAWGQQSALVAALDSLVSNNLPSGWSFLGNTNALHVWDAYLTRINGAWGSPVVGTPAQATLTAGYNAAGTLPTCSAGNAPRIVHTFVGASDYNESLPSAEAVQVALTGSQNSFTYQPPGNVPAGVKKIRLYRSGVGGAAGFYPFAKDVSEGLVPGTPCPALTLTESDLTLRPDVTPPAWLCALMVAEFAALFALAFSGAAGSNALFGSQNTAQTALVMNALSMLSPGNVLLNPSNNFLGVGNPASSGEFGRSVLTGSGAQTWTAGTLQTANNPVGNSQGFAGASSLQSRVVSALGAGATFTLSYVYYDAANGWGVNRTQAAVSVVHATGAVGETIAIAVPAGRLVQSVTVSAVSGAATTGQIVLEAATPRF